ncbi:MAG TPA: ATP-dependent helicase, partial [Planctomycetaceae bacterium]
MSSLAPDPLLDGLNDAQRRAVTHGDSPLLIVAGAGTGKTTTLARRVAWLIRGGVDPGRVLLLTFTRRAAAEMIRRADGLLAAAGDGQAAKAVWGGTFHAVAVRLLRRFGAAIGLPPNFTILDRSDAEDLLGSLRADLGLGDAKTRFPGKPLCADIYSRVVNSQRPLEEVLDETYPGQRPHALDLKALFRAYTTRKESEHLLDYDDLLLFWEALLAHPEAGAAVRERFTHVLVDEYQDTNRLQAAILKRLRPDDTGLTVVGDDAQAIYAFRAATVRNILDFPQEFPGAAVVALEQNYRSTQPILDVANAVIAAAKEWHEKTLRATRTGGTPPVLVRCEDEDRQSEAVVARVLEHLENGLPLRRQAVLFRASHHALNLELELNRRGIPFQKYGGLKFLETAHVKDLMAFL